MQALNYLINFRRFYQQIFDIFTLMGRYREIAFHSNRLIFIGTLFKVLFNLRPLGAGERETFPISIFKSNPTTFTYKSLLKMR